MCIYIYVYMYIYIYIYVQMYIYIYIYTDVYIYINTGVYIYYTCIYRCIICIYIYICIFLFHSSGTVELFLCSEGSTTGGTWILGIFLPCHGRPRMCLSPQNVAWCHEIRQEQYTMWNKTSNCIGVQRAEFHFASIWINAIQILYNIIGYACKYLRIYKYQKLSGSIWKYLYDACMYL